MVGTGVAVGGVVGVAVGTSVARRVGRGVRAAGAAWDGVLVALGVSRVGVAAASVGTTVDVGTNVSVGLGCRAGARVGATAVAEGVAVGGSGNVSVPTDSLARTGEGEGVGVGLRLGAGAAGTLTGAPRVVRSSRRFCTSSGFGGSAISVVEETCSKRCWASLRREVIESESLEILTGAVSSTAC